MEKKPAVTEPNTQPKPAAAPVPGGQRPVTDAVVKQLEALGASSKVIAFAREEASKKAG